MNQTKLLITLTALAILPFCLKGQGKDSITKTNFQAGNCNINSMTVNYSIRSLMGEPVVNGAFKWSAGYQTDAECLPYNTKVSLKVEDMTGGYAYITISPTVPDSDDGFGYNASGSPNWDDLFCGWGDRYINNCFSESDAKQFWKNGFDVTDFEVWW